jgi:hypothetical protein
MTQGQPHRSSVSTGSQRNMKIASERSMKIAEHTREGLAKARAAGKRLGRPSRCDPYVCQLVVDLHCRGYSLREIADEMTIRQIPTPAGRVRPWIHTHVQRLLKTRLAHVLIADRCGDGKTADLSQARQDDLEVLLGGTVPGDGLARPLLPKIFSS